MKEGNCNAYCCSSGQQHSKESKVSEILVLVESTLIHFRRKCIKVLQRMGTNSYQYEEEKVQPYNSS